MEFLNEGLATVQHRLAFVATDPIDWKFYVQVFSWGVCAFESYLLLRQYPLYSKTVPPRALAEHFSPEVFKASQEYGKDKAKFAFVTGIYKQIIDSALLQYGAYAWAWDVAGRAISKLGYSEQYEITQSLVFVAILYFVSTIPSLPLSVYSTFVLEERHGFNKTTPSLFITDLLKSWVIGIAIGGPFLAAFLWVFKWAGDRFIPWLMAFMLAFQISMVIIYPTVIQPLFNKLSPLADGELRTRIEALASKLKFPLKHLYEIDGSKRSSHSNAYFFGLPWSKHIVIFDTLIKESKPEEVEAVLAHELGHWFFMHPTKLLLVSQVHLFTILSLFPAFMHAPPVLRAFDFPKQVAARPPTMVAFLIFQMILTPLEAIVGIAMNAVSRRFEYQADRFACELKDKLKNEDMADMGTRLGRALVQLHVKNLSTVWVDWLYSAYHHSHPTLTERLKALESYGISCVKVVSVTRLPSRCDRMAVRVTHGHTRRTAKYGAVFHGHNPPERGTSGRTFDITASHFIPQTVRAKHRFECGYGAGAILMMEVCHGTKDLLLGGTIFPQHLIAGCWTALIRDGSGDLRSRSAKMAPYEGSRFFVLFNHLLCKRPSARPVLHSLAHAPIQDAASLLQQLTSPVKQTEAVTSRKDVQNSSTVQQTPTDPAFLLHHLSQCPDDACVTYTDLPRTQKKLIQRVLKPAGSEKTIYDPFSDFLTYLSGRIYNLLPTAVQEENAVIEFVPNGERRMVGHPGQLELSASYAPDCVGVEGLRADFVVRTRKGRPEYGSIPYHRASTLIEIKPRSKHGVLQSISYAWYHMQARPDRPGVYCLAANPEYYQITWVDPLGPVSSERYKWKDGNNYQLYPLLCFMYSLYVPPAGHITKDPSINVHNVTIPEKPTWDIRSAGKTYENCKLVSFQPPWGRRTTVFLHVKDGVRTIVKDYYRDNKRRFKEENLIAQIHSNGLVPGVIRLEHHEEVKANGEVITTAQRAKPNDESVELRTKMRFIFSSVGKKLDKVSSLKELLMVFFDLNEIHRALLHMGVLHRDISANNVLICPTHRFSKGNIQLSSNPRLISDILRSETNDTTVDHSTCLLIDFDNSANLFSSTKGAKEDVKVLAQRTGTPMYIARAVSAGALLPKQWHRKFYPMPELSGKARELYDEAWGAASYEEYCDRDGRCHGSVVPDKDALEVLFDKLTTEPLCHRPRHDVESMFWTLFVTVLKAVPKSDLHDAQSGAFIRTWGIFEQHAIGPLPSFVSDSRDSILRDLIEEGPRFLSSVLHPAFVKTPLPRVLVKLAHHIAPEYELLEGIGKADHLHEAWRRLLLECLAEIDGSPGLDVELDPGARRGRKLKRGRLNGSYDGGPDTDDDGDARGKPRARTTEPQGLHSLGGLNPLQYVHTCRTII
ncbi:hypothetical protein NM688_g5060 [Phlebia brevispora]|uniref:Uncharacterized protein n=1 Tax=Phlebia brevispora TaxID=194682 RepID=A0ACC1T199_9APHY|nr:hypothetical protein NM688_g5060 [Phlebia brevispora]